MATTGKNKNGAHPSPSAAAEPVVSVAEVLEAHEVATEEVLLLFELGRVLGEFAARPGRPPSRFLYLDGQRHTPRDRVLSRVRRLLAERGVEAGNRARDLLMLSVSRAP